MTLLRERPIDLSTLTTLRVTISTAELKRALTVVKPFVCVRNGALPVLSCIRVDAGPVAVTISGTDLDGGAAVTISCEVSGMGSVLLPLKTFAAMLPKGAKGWPTVGIMAISDTEVELIVNGQSSTMFVPPVADYPVSRDLSGGTAYNVDVAALASVLPAVANTMDRPILSGAYFAGPNIVGTDSYRLHVTSGYTDYPNVIVSKPVLAQIVKSKLTTVAMTVHPFGVSFDGGSGSIWWQRITDGTFPNWQQLMPSDHPNVIRFDRLAMVAGIERVASMATEQHTPVRLAISALSVVLTVTERDRGTATAMIPLSWSTDIAPGTVLAFNPKYLIDCLSVGSGDECEVHFLDSLKPALVVDESSCRRLLMPVRIA